MATTATTIAIPAVPSVTPATFVTVITCCHDGAEAASTTKNGSRDSAARTLSRRQNQNVQAQKSAAKTAAIAGYWIWKLETVSLSGVADFRAA